MGCCLSKTDSSPNTHLPRLTAPLSPLLEEKTVVKEVLSETPALKPPQLSVKIEEEKPPATPPPPPVIPSKIEEDKKTEEISETVSEIYSLSESFSTTAVTEKKEVVEEVQQKVVDRTPAKVRRKRSIPGDFNGRSERGSKSPARRAEQSPSRTNDGNAVKSEVSRLPRRSSGSNGPRRDPVEGSGRRSRSPATRTGGAASRAFMGRSPSRRAGRTPATVPENGRKSLDSVDAKRPANESLENPLVSLECFIFL